jgi:TDG/mug DNA glycosylase family protein
VLEYGIGLTDLAKLHFGADHELPHDAFDAVALKRKLARYKPAIVAFTSKNAAFGCFRRALAYGEQTERIGMSRVFVLASPSGQARKFWTIEPWRELADAVARL